MQPVLIDDRKARRRQWSMGVFCLLAAVLVVMVDGGHRWSWSLLAWGLAVGALGVIGNHTITRIGLRAIKLSPEERTTAEARIHADHLAVYPSFLLMSVGVAIAAAGLDSAALAVLFVIYVVLANILLPLFLLPHVVRRAADARAVVAGHSCASSRDCGATACSTCPIATQHAQPNSA